MSWSIQFLNFNEIALDIFANIVSSFINDDIQLW